MSELQKAITLLDEFLSSGKYPSFQEEWKLIKQCALSWEARLLPSSIEQISPSVQDLLNEFNLTWETVAGQCCPDSRPRSKKEKNK